MRALLDVSMLLALFDSGHTFHRVARSWWGEHGEFGWASCPLSQNGYLRIVSQKSYTTPVRLTDALAQLKSWAVPPDHEFWPDDLSILDDDHIDHTRLLGPRQLTDVYLLALAVKHDGRLVTFDRNISWQAARNGSEANLVVVG